MTSFPTMPTDHKRLIIVSLLALIVLVGWHVFSPRGLVRYMQLRGQLAELHRTNSDLEKDNTSLAREVFRLQNDDLYFEDIARRRYGLIKKNEIIFDFSSRR